MSLWEQWRKEDSVKQRYGHRSISGQAILEEQEGQRAIRIDASFCLNYYRVLPFLPSFFSTFHSPHLNFNGVPIALLGCFHKQPFNSRNIHNETLQSYSIFLNSHESSSILVIYSRNFVATTIKLLYPELISARGFKRTHDSFLVV